MSRWARRSDTNSQPIFAVLRAFKTPHASLEYAGAGFPDGIAWIREQWRLFEIKNPSMSYGKRGLNDNQREWIDKVNGGPIYILESETDAELFARGKLSKLKSVQPEAR